MISNDIRSEESAREEAGCGGNEDVWNHRAGQNKEQSYKQIRGTTKVGEISTEMRESRLKWYEHNEKGRRRMGIGGDGCAGEEILKGRPNQVWMDSIKDDLTEKGLSGDETHD